MAQDLKDNFPSSDIEIMAINEIRHHSANQIAADLTDLPLLQDIDANQDNLSDTWEDWSVRYRDVQIVDSSGELQSVLNLTDEANLIVDEDYATLRKMIVDVATANNVAGSQWQNAREPLDTNADDNISPIDLRDIVTTLNDDGPGPLTSAVAKLVDVTGDGIASARDALHVVLHLNAVNDRLSAGEPPSGEPPVSDHVDAFLASMIEVEDDDEDQNEHDVS